MALAEPHQRSKETPSPLPIAAEGKSQESQSVSERIAQWLKTCLEDWDAATHTTQKEWRTTCERVSQERGKSLRENPERNTLPDSSNRQKTGSSFVDRFATLDSKRWYISHGWANGPHQNCTWINSNVRVVGSVALSLTDKPSADRPYTCAEIQTREFFGYGTYEVRMRSVAAPGTVSAFFTFTGSPHGPQRPHDEINFEFLGKSPTQVFLNYFASGRKHEQYVPLPFDATAAANDYAFEWTAEGIRWFANGRLIREVKASAGADLPITPQKIYLSIWNGTGWDQEAWLGRFAYPGRPLIAVFERLAFTEAGAACQFPESVVCRKQ